MATTLDIGSTLETAAKSTVSLHVPSGVTVTVKNTAGPTLSHYTNLHGSASATTAQGSTNTQSGPGAVHLIPSGRTTITLTGGSYGS